MANLALLQNLNCFISTFNTKFKDFNKIQANRGDTVTFDLPPRFISNPSLIAVFQDAEQRVQSLTVDQAENIAYQFTAQEFIFNVEDYMEKFGKSATAEMGAVVEANVAQNCVTAPYRFFGDGINPINSYTQLAQALALFRNYGAATKNTIGYLSDVAVPTIIGSGLTQFATNRNNEIANSWEVGSFSRTDWCQSNLLPVHVAGTEGEQDTTLTVVSVVTDADGGISAITFSGTNAAADADSIKNNDKLQFQDGVAGQPNMRYRTFIGHEVSANTVQVRVTADAASTAGSEVTVQITPKLYNAAGRNQNTNNLVAAGMQVKALPSHRAGMIISGDAGYLAMPQLPEETPFPTGNAYDPDTGVSMRMYHGSKFGLNERGMVHDAIWGSTVVPEYAMSLIFPL